MGTFTNNYSIKGEHSIQVQLYSNCHLIHFSLSKVRFISYQLKHHNSCYTIKTIITKIIIIITLSVCNELFRSISSLKILK